ncbi:hypothetical protein BX600DRAFT_11311 [Xylariales sp. PMI_506]|nr:hypothetical protein BX600DRAFT_11311 [Xylariales sp. PMI_506]
MGSLKTLIPPLPKAGKPKSVQPQRVRAAFSRSTNGCTTCKQKHVKCDELRPICSRCILGGYSCVFKGRFQSRPTTRSILPAPMHGSQASLQAKLRPSMGDLVGSDVVYFDIFRHEVINDIAGIGYSEFWTQTIMKHSATKGPIQHSILAIGALSMALEGSEVMPQSSRRILTEITSSKNHLQAALKHHAEALADFRENLLQKGGALDPRTILLATMMLVAFEVLLGSCANAAYLLIRCHKMLRLQVSTTNTKIPTSDLAIANPEDAATIADIMHMLPRLALINNVLPLLPPDACFELLHGEVKTLVVPSYTDSPEVLFRSWKEFSFAKIQLNSEAQWAAEQKDDAVLPFLEHRLSVLLDKAVLWGDVINYHMLRETDGHYLHRLRIMKIQQLAMLSLRRDQQQSPILDIFRQILAICNDIFTARPTSYATRFQMDAVVSPIFACMLSGRSVRVRKAVLRIARQYAHDGNGRLKTCWTSVIMALKLDVDPPESLNVLGEEVQSYNDVVDSWWQGTGVLLKH